uniref:hypothetical protein n=1 Tax=Streptomyces asoensis TaxID=249586 RepID=UPI00209C5553|nr:hypothetical protein [Streptomyces asoensis]
MPAHFHLLVGQVLDERGDGRLVRLRALVEVGKINHRSAGAPAARPLDAGEG